MTTRTEIELVLDRYLAEGAETVSDRVIDAALDEIDHTTQRRALRVPWRFTTMPTTLKLAAAAAAVLAVIVAGSLFINRGSGPPVGATPQPAPSPTVSSSAAAPSTLPAVADVPATEAEMPPGAYRSDRFDPPIAFRLDRCCYRAAVHDENFLVIEEIGYVRYLVLSRPTGVIEPATGDVEPLPADLVDWLAAHPGLEAGAPQPVTLGGIEGRQIEGNPLPTANYDVNGHLQLTQAPRPEDLFVEPDWTFRIAVLDEPSGPLLVATFARSDKFEEFRPNADAVLETLSVGD